MNLIVLLVDLYELIFKLCDDLLDLVTTLLYSQASISQTMLDSLKSLL